MSERKTIHVLYHANCYDGFGSAYAAWKSLGDKAEYHPMDYGWPLPFEATPGDTMFLVDYSLPAEMIRTLVGMDISVIVLDHHKTALENLKALGDELGEDTDKHLELHLDMNRSGTGITWGYFFPDREMPLILKNIQDRDLWRFEIPFTKQVHAALCTMPFDFEVWDRWVRLCHSRNSEGYDSIIERGEHALEYHKQLVENFVKEARLMRIGNWTVPVVNICMLFSEVPERLLELYPDAPFAAYRYYLGDGKVKYGLRSRSDFDVSEVAKAFGGGGHPQAAGFKCVDMTGR